MTISQSEPLISIQAQMPSRSEYFVGYTTTFHRFRKFDKHALSCSCRLVVFSSELSCSLLSKELRNSLNNDLELYPVSLFSLKTTFIISCRTNRPVITWS